MLPEGHRDSLPFRCCGWEAVPVLRGRGKSKERFAKRAQKPNSFGLCRAPETKVALPNYFCFILSTLRVFFPY